MKLSAIVAMDRNGAIGKNNTIPWRCKDDMAFFKRVTLNNVVIMGRNTWNSLPIKPLPDRINVVMSNDHGKIEDILNVNHLCSSVTELETILEKYNGYEHIIIGGGVIYNLFKDQIKTHYISLIDTEIEGADTWYPFKPEELMDKWRIDISTFEKSDRNEFGFKIYEIF